MDLVAGGLVSVALGCLHATCFGVAVEPALWPYRPLDLPPPMIRSLLLELLMMLRDPWSHLSCSLLEISESWFFAGLERSLLLLVRLGVVQLAFWWTLRSTPAMR